MCKAMRRLHQVPTYEPCKAIVRAYCSRFTTRGKESWFIFEHQLHMAGFPHRSVGMRQSHTGTFLEPRYSSRSQAPANGDPLDEGGALHLQVIQKPCIPILQGLIARHSFESPFQSWFIQSFVSRPLVHAYASGSESEVDTLPPIRAS